MPSSISQMVAASLYKITQSRDSQVDEKGEVHIDNEQSSLVTECINIEGHI